MANSTGRCEKKIYTKKDFQKETERLLAQAGPCEYCMVAMDIEHFKLFNEWHGTEAGNLFLQEIGCLLAEAAGDGGIAGYMGEDDFCLLLPNNEARLSALQKSLQDYVLQKRENAGFLPAYGAYRIEDTLMPVSAIYDRAVIALNSVKGNYAKRIGWYDISLKDKLAQSHRMLSEVRRALDNGEITFYLQPKCRMQDGKIVGMEALVRWIDPERGVVPPCEFVGVLENNGFISELDQYIWDKVCTTIRRWIDSGRRPVPISVNVSRIDMYALDVVKVFTDLTKKYQLPPGLVELEITESAYAEESGMISGIVDRLRSAGFRALMDDFGTGYSSLNMLKDVNVDALKIDMKFLEMNENSADKGLGILETIVRMARLMGLQLIAEGAENRTQVEFLLDMGCLYGQGYYFYHPLPIEEAEALLDRRDKFDFEGMQTMAADLNEAGEIRRRMGLILKHAKENIVLAKFSGNRVRYEVIACGVPTGFGATAEECERTLNADGVCRAVGEEERERLRKNIRHAVQEKAPYQDVIKLRSPSGRAQWMDLKISYAGDGPEGRVYLCIGSDVTLIKEKEQEIWLIGKKLEQILRQAGINSWEWDIDKKQIMIPTIPPGEAFASLRGGSEAVR